MEYAQRLFSAFNLVVIQYEFPKIHGNYSDLQPCLSYAITATRFRSGNLNFFGLFILQRFVLTDTDAKQI